jgi:hypothetical protein
MQIDKKELKEFSKNHPVVKMVCDISKGYLLLSEVSWNRINQNRKFNKIKTILADNDLTDVE